MATLTVEIPSKHDALLLAMTREMMGQVEVEDDDPRDATPAEAVSFWEKRFTDSIVFFGKKYFNKQQAAQLEDAPDITIE